ncbi:MAG: DUF4115 domain-containing protein [Propionivibrio sp.]
MKNDSNSFAGDDADLVVGASPHQATVRPSVGQQLQIGRERSGMSVDDVARALKLSTRQVESLEDSDWGRLPGKTLIRGFVRNYARLVGLDGQVLMSELEGATLPKSPELRGALGTPVSMPKEGKSDRRDVFRVLAGVLVLILAVLAYFFLPADIWQSTVQAFNAASQSNQAEVDVASEPSSAPFEAPPVSAETNEPVPTEPPIVPPGTASEAIPEIPAPVAETPVANVLKFSFAQPSWVEVRDRNGQVIFSQRNPGGSQRDIEGQPPFSVVIGNAAHVTLQYKGSAVDLSKRSKDDVARVTVE